jgi:hypothetical protein
MSAAPGMSRRAISYQLSAIGEWLLAAGCWLVLALADVPACRLAVSIVPPSAFRLPPSGAVRVSASRRVAPVPEPTRGGEDVRRRGWFWHWNALVTQYAPLIGLKGVGLLNSYTVWTDRREESPHRGFAFPSQQSEADFYGEDRAELIAINKILVALDLIEIRKEMVVRADPQGRRWKVPHNFYRVKDHGDDFALTAADVLRVAELAARDRAVYRYVRRVFSPRFAPIDGDNVWTRILPEVRQTRLWAELAAKAAAEEDRASARTRAGHAARKSGAAPAAAADSPSTPPFFVPVAGAGAASRQDGNDSAAVTYQEGEPTSVASVNTGSTVAVGASNTGSRRSRPGTVAPANEAGPTSVAPANTTYHQSSTTTRKPVQDDDRGVTTAVAEEVRIPPGGNAKRQPGSGPGPRPPADAAGEAAALRAFESANDRAATPAERKLLRDLAARFAPVAGAMHEARPDVPGSGWGWLEAAVWEAVTAGSAFVAPRRLREILIRWEREGFPAPDDPAPEPPRPSPLRPARQVEEPLRPTPLPPLFTVEEVGLSNRQVWAAVLTEVARQGQVSPGELETWLRPAGLIGREGDALVVGAPNAVARERLATRLFAPLLAAVQATVGAPLVVRVVVADEPAEWGGEAAS